MESPQAAFKPSTLGHAMPQKSAYVPSGGDAMAQDVIATVVAGADRGIEGVSQRWILDCGLYPDRIPTRVYTSVPCPLPHALPKSS